MKIAPIILTRMGLVVLALVVAVAGLSFRGGQKPAVPLLDAEAGAAYAAEGDPPAKPAPWVIVPDVGPAPVPAPAPGSVPKLAEDEMYVLDCKEACFALVYPPRIVQVTQEAGPIKIRGKFVGGSGQTETKTFTGKVVLVVTAYGTGRVQVNVVKEGAKGPADVFRQEIDANTAPIPPPPPPPPPKPPDPPPVPPTPTGLRVLLVYESSANMTNDQYKALYSAKIEDYLTRKCTDGKKGWRRLDRNANLDTHEPKLWLDLWAATKGKITTVPSIVIVVGESGTAYPITNEQSTMDLLIKTAGQ